MKTTISFWAIVLIVVLLALVLRRRIFRATIDKVACQRVIIVIVLLCLVCILIVLSCESLPDVSYKILILVCSITYLLAIVICSLSDDLSIFISLISNCFSIIIGCLSYIFTWFQGSILDLVLIILGVVHDRLILYKLCHSSANIFKN